MIKGKILAPREFLASEMGWGEGGGWGMGGGGWEGEGGWGGMVLGK